jgi:hypothetical protein
MTTPDRRRIHGPKAVFCSNLCSNPEACTGTPRQSIGLGLGSSKFARHLLAASGTASDRFPPSAPQCSIALKSEFIVRTLVLFAGRVGAKLGATSGRPLRRERASSLQSQPSVLIFVWRGLPRFWRTPSSRPVALHQRSRWTKSSEARHAHVGTLSRPAIGPKQSANAMLLPRGQN